MPNLNQRRGSELILREALRRDVSRDSISGSRPLQPQRTSNQHPAVASRSLSLQAAPSSGAMEKAGPFAKRSRSTKKREGKTQSLICFNIPEGKYLKDLMWDRPVLEAFKDKSVFTTPKKNNLISLYSTISWSWRTFLPSCDYQPMTFEDPEHVFKICILNFCASFQVLLSPKIMVIFIWYHPQI